MQHTKHVDATIHTDEASKAMQLLNRESLELLKSTNGHGTIERITGTCRAIRASLVSSRFTKPSDRLATNTNCIGATTVFNLLVANECLRATTGIIKAYPWQHKDNERETHLVSIIHDKSTGKYYFAGPMPVSGYFYGTYGELGLSKSDGLFRATDRLLGASTLIQQLSDTELAAIIDVALAYNANGSLSETWTGRLLYAAEALQNVGSYRMRAYIVLDKLNPNGQCLKTHAKARALRDSAASLIPKSKAAVRFEEIIRHERLVRLDYAQRVGQIIKACESPYDINYWTSVDITLNQGYSVIANHQATNLSWQKFVDSSTRPVKQYESYMLKNFLGLRKSDLYRENY